MKTIRIVAAAVTLEHLKLYQEDGEQILIPQGDPRLRKVLEQAVPQLEANTQEDGTTWADVNLEPDFDNTFADFQEKSAGVRFFRVAKAALKKLFNSELGPDTTRVRPQYHGRVPAAPVPPSPAATSAPATPVAVATAPVAEGAVDIFIHGPGKMQVSPDGLITGVTLGDERMDGFDKSDDAQDALRDEAAAAAEVTEGAAAQPEQDIVDFTMSLGEKDDQAETFEPVVQVPETKVAQVMSMVDEIIAHATPVTDPSYNEDGIVKQRPMAINGETSKQHPDDSAEDTIIAVVDDKVIPDVELIKSQFGHAASKGSTVGMENFMKRLAGVIEQRSHSVKDLLRFMERADLPVGDDGSIIIYKILKRRGDKYVDCHSEKVEQWIGTYVCMDPSLVDHNRNNECSNGLHVARRGYIRSFSGDVCVVAKLAPEDVITIPAYDANKMRVCGYHILEELPDDLYQMLQRNEPITNTEKGKQILANVIAGNHIRKTHEVRITGQMGSGIIVTEIPEAAEPVPVLAPENIPTVVALPEDHDQAKDEEINPANVEEVAKAAMTKREQAKVLYDAWVNAPEELKAQQLDTLKAFKKSSKKGWDVLGINDPAVTGVAPVYTKEVERDLKAIRKPAAVPVKQALPAASEGSPRDRIAKLLTLGLNKDVCQKVYDIKKASKKAWNLLGVTDAQIATIMKAIGKE